MTENREPQLRDAEPGPPTPATPATPATANTGLQLYVYCLADSACAPACANLARQPLPGVDGRHVIDALYVPGLVAVYGAVDAAEFCDENLQQLAWLAPRAFRHEAVVEWVMQAGAVLPLRFGTLFHDLRSLGGFLLEHRLELLERLDGLRGKNEWSVKGYVLDEPARRMLADSDPVLRSRAAALPRSPGARYLQQKQLDRAIDDALHLHVARWTGEVQHTLELHAAACTPLRCHGSALTHRTDRMVFNTSYLVTHRKQDAFRALLQDLDTALQGSGLSLELRGPWPPYNFCTGLPRQSH